MAVRMVRVKNLCSEQPHWQPQSQPQPAADCGDAVSARPPGRPNFTHIHDLGKCNPHDAVLRSLQHE